MAELEKKATTAVTSVEVLFWYTTGFTRVDLESFTYPSGVYYERDFYASLVRKSVLYLPLELPTGKSGGHSLTRP